MAIAWWRRVFHLVLIGGVVTGRKPGVGVAVVVGLPGAAARAATKGRRDTALHIVHRDDDGREHDCPLRGGSQQGRDVDRGAGARRGRRR